MSDTVIDIDPVRTGLGLFRCVARTELNEKVPGLCDDVFLHLNHAITEAYKLGFAAGRGHAGKDKVPT